jgi:6-phosphogluconolactonase
MMANHRPDIRVLPDPDFVARAAADTFERLARSKAEEGKVFTVVLSGGSTPVRLFALLAAEPYRSLMPWGSIHFFWGDERTVPPGDPESNFGVANATLLSQVNVPEDNIHRMKGESTDPMKAAADYEAELLRFFGLTEGEVPRIDLVFLGMGPDGHTASLFPGTQALSEARRLAVAPWIEKLQTHRITLTCPVFNKAACVQFLATVKDKAETLEAVLRGDPANPQYPAQLIRPESGDLTWLVDEAAASLL